MSFVVPGMGMFIEVRVAGGGGRTRGGGSGSALGQARITLTNATSFCMYQPSAHKPCPPPPPCLVCLRRPTLCLRQVVWRAGGGAGGEWARTAVAAG